MNSLIGDITRFRTSHELLIVRQDITSPIQLAAANAFADYVQINITADCQTMNPDKNYWVRITPLNVTLQVRETY